MRYYTKVVKEDEALFNKIRISQLAKMLGLNETYLYRVRQGKIIVSEKQYFRLKGAIDAYLKGYEEKYK